MNSVDYTKKMDEERNRYYRQLQDNRKANKEAIKNLEETHQKQIEKKSKVHRQQIDKMTRDAEKTSLEKNKKIRARIQDEQNKLQEQLSRTNKENYEQLQSTRKNYRERLDSINKEYDQNLNRINDTNAQIRDANRKGYNEKIAANSRNQEKKLQDLEGVYRKQQDKLVSRSNESKRKLKSEFDTENRKLKIENKVRYQNFREDTRDKVAKLKESQDQELDTVRRVANYNAESRSKSTQEMLDKSFRDFSAKTDEIREKAQLDAQKVARENSRQIEDISRGHALSNRTMDVEASQKNDARLRRYAIDVNNEFKEKNYDNRFEQLKGSKEKMAQQYERKLEKAEKDFKDFRVQSKIEQANRDSAREVQTAQDRMELIRTERGARQEQKEMYVEKISSERDANQAAHALKDARMKRSEGKMLNEYATRLGDLEEANKRATESLKEEFSNSKAEFVKATQERESKNYREVKNTFQDKMNRQTEEYDRKSSLQARESERITNELKNQIAHDRSESRRKIKSQEKLFSEKEKLNRESMMDLMASRERDLKRVLNDTHNRYMGRLNEKEMLHRKKIKQLTQDYETQLSELTREKNRENSIKNSIHAREKVRLQENFRAEKDRIVTQYENLIANLRKSHQDHMDKIRDYMHGRAKEQRES